LIHLRKPTSQDGSKIFQLAQTAGSLDVNSAYHYLLMCQKFSDTCVVAVEMEEPIGFLTAFRDPERSEILFIWQIAVSQYHRQQGIARKMVNHLLMREFQPEIRFLETTITRSNVASQTLFRNLAKELDSELKEQIFFDKELFSETGHEAEHLFQIGPFNHNLQR